MPMKDEQLTTPAYNEMEMVAESRGTALPPPVPVEVGLLTGCQDRPYALGLAIALASMGVCLDFIGSDKEDSPELHQSPQLKFHNLKRNRRTDAGPLDRGLNLLVYYARLMRYAAAAEAKVLHILWNNRLEYFDRTLLMLYFRALRKRVVITAHNVNIGKRDSNDSLLNRITLKAQYLLVDHIFVHTAKMKHELCEDFGVPATAVTVIRHPVNDAFPNTELTPPEARQRMGIGPHEKAILFFGRIRPYKGLECLLTAFQQVATRDPDYRLIIVGESKKGCEGYFDEIQRAIQANPHRSRIIQRTEFIPDHDIEVYLKAADVLVLPYKEIFQSGVLFLAYSFGLPVVAADVGSFREEIIEGETGFLCRPCDPEDLTRVIETYFASDLFRHLHRRRPQIQDYAFSQHSWKAVAELTRNVYVELLGGCTS
jgi:glycosyltransferase involved in cell wall biosynthesis